MKASPKSCDIFCRVVDNYGDIGVCWRLAKQLAHEHGLVIRLFVDELTTAKHLIPSLNVKQSKQTISQVEIVHWQNRFLSVSPADIVIEAFACDLPDSYLQAMTEIQPVWLNLEYLSAESWVDGFYGKSSKHPTLPLTKYFFFPGFNENTGSLLREKTLTEDRQSFQGSVEAQIHFWQKLEIPDAIDSKDELLKVSLFAYPEAPVADLLKSFKNSSRPILCLLPGKGLLNAIQQHFDWNVSENSRITLGNLTLQHVPFLSQTEYDQLLWACDLNFVRGEDSWIRAIWAAKPMVWQPYQQTEQAHLPKLNAFLDLYTQGLPDASKQVVERFYRAWSSNHLGTDDWQKILDQLPTIATQSKNFSDRLAQQTDLATRLVSFCKNPTYPV
ncbi:MAG: elongation factor P maturation arginine rhamnosyltransferase EarP [Methylophilaceae bacterium]|nr:elongation factor P maturation arginine rhamnosyltransferase EarP [Methyloradius sp.]